MVKLKYCPFCGGEAEMRHILRPCVPKCQEFRIACLECSALGSIEITKEKAIQAWNTRYEPPTPRGILVPFGNARFNK